MEVINVQVLKVLCLRFHSYFILNVPSKYASFKALQNLWHSTPLFKRIIFPFFKSIT
jgi:hypothetical protein